MTRVQIVRTGRQACRAVRFTAFAFECVSCFTFLITILYAIGFVSGLAVPKTIDIGARSGAFEAIVVNIGLMSLVAVCHGFGPRRWFKHWRTRVVAVPFERSCYVLCASLTLLLLFWQWRPMTMIVWDAREPEMAMLIATLSFLGWVVAFTGIFAILSKPVRREATPRVARTPPRHRSASHPIYLGLIVAFWSTPVMTVGHLLFAAAGTALLFIDMCLEKHGLVSLFGERYPRNRKRVPMLFPRHRPT